MKTIKSVIIALLVMAMATPAMADDFVNSVLGAALGGAAGSKVGKGNGRKAAIVAGALGGAYLGANADQGTERRHRENLQMQKYAADNQHAGYSGGVQRVVLEQPQRQVVEYVDAPVQRRQAVQQRFSACDEEYYNGVYDPEVAQAYCAGQVERERQEINRSKKEKERAMRAAFAAGLNGQ